MAYSEDTIRILVSSDNHVGYGEGDGERTNDSWRTFDEVLSLASQNDVDMVLLGGDLFHENHPSRKAMSEVVNSLSEHCQGDKPVALEVIGDQSEHFPGRANRVNYMNPNMNISIPVFSIHGNHDDPTGPEHKSALDLLHDAGLLNYYGRVHQADKINVKPLLLQKGTTKLALYGLSNVRDERLFQTFRDHGVKFFTPSQAKDEWYNILSVHQNHTPHSDSAYLPEASLPASMDMIIWGHEHECKIEPRTNAELGFKVMQPGSTVATSLIPGEAVQKKVAILNITGKTCKVETIALKTVRPFIYRDIVLKDEKEMRAVVTKANNLILVKQFCQRIVESMIEEADEQYLENNPDFDEAVDTIPLPLIRLRVEYSPPSTGGYEFQVEQNQRFSQEYRGRVANVNDVIQFHKRRTVTKRVTATAAAPDSEVLDELESETIKVADLVREYLGVQTLTMLPQNLFSDAVGQFVDKGDKKAIDQFVADSVNHQIKMLAEGRADEDEEADQAQIEADMAAIKAEIEESFRKGELKARSSSTKKLLPKPDDWNTDEQGRWSDYPGAQAGEDDDSNNDGDSDASASKRGATRGRGRGRARAGRTAAPSTRKPASKAPAKSVAKPKGRKQPFDEDNDDDDDNHDIMIIDDDVDDDVQDSAEGGLFVSQASAAPVRKTAPRAAPRAKAPAKQSTLSFGSAATRAVPARAAAKPPPRRQPSEDEIDSDDDAFESAVPVSRSRRR